MVDKDALKEALDERKSRMSGRTKGKGTHYFRFEKDEDQALYEAIAEIVGTSSPSQLQTAVCEFITEHLEEFQEEQG